MKNTSAYKLKTDLIANYLSLGILAVCGLLFHIIIATQYGAATLGLFNLSMAIYVICSQFSVMGLHSAVLHYISIDKKLAAHNLISGLILTGILAAVFSSSIYLLRAPLSQLFSSPDLQTSLTWIALGLFFFSLNKVFLAFFNAMERMKIFAFLQSTRYIVVLISIFLIPQLGLTKQDLTASFFISEAFVFILCLVFAKIDWPKSQSPYNRNIHKNILTFGSKSFLSGAFLELNLRLDILVIGFLMSDYWVGVYSFAATFAEGFMQFFIVIKNQLNPQIAQMVAAGRIPELEIKIAKWRKHTYQFTAVVALGILCFCYFYVQYAGLSGDFRKSIEILAILLFGVWITSGSHTFDTVLLYGGEPFAYTKYVAVMVISNLILNFSLVPLLNLEGAAVATILSYVVGAFVLYRYIKSKFKMNYFKV